MPGDRGTDAEGASEAYLERVLAPSLGPRQVMMDNLPAHKEGRVRDRRARGSGVLYLPPCSPDLDVIEHAFTKAKGVSQKTEARSREALIGAMGRRRWTPLRPTKLGSFSDGAVTVRWTKRDDRRSSAVPISRAMLSMFQIAPKNRRVSSRPVASVTFGCQPNTPPASVGSIELRSCSPGLAGP